MHEIGRKGGIFTILATDFVRFFNKSVGAILISFCHAERFFILFLSKLVLSNYLCK